MQFVRWQIFLYILFIASCAPQPTKEIPAEFQLGQKHFHKCIRDKCVTTRYKCDNKPR